MSNDPRGNQVKVSGAATSISLQVCPYPDVLQVLSPGFCFLRFVPHGFE